MLGTGLTGVVDQSDWSELSWCSCSVLRIGLHAFVQGELHWFRGACMCAGGALCVVRALFWWSFALCLSLVFFSVVLSRCSCLRGQRLVFFMWLCSLPCVGLLIAFWSFFVPLFSFPFLFGYANVFVVNALIKGEIEDLCCSRTGGWSLIGAMSDWQRCVDWQLSKYCRCRLRLDWC
jgi:hypothetical protein